MKKSITLTEVAKIAGVSVATVSKVLSNQSGDVKISDATRKKVIDAAKQLNYRPNPFASALRKKKTGVLGAIVRDINDPFLSQLAREIQLVANSKGIELLLGHAGHEVTTARRQLNLMRTWFDGLLIIGDMPRDELLFHEVEAFGLPFVAVACGSHHKIPHVNVDEEEGTVLLLEYLYKLGHRRIAAIGDMEHVGTRERLTAFENFVRSERLFWMEEYLQSCRLTRAEGLRHTHQLLSLSEPPSAIFCASDILALGAIAAAWQKGWRVPYALSIAGFDDIEDAETAVPPLTTVRQPMSQMAEAALDVILSKLQHGDETIATRQILIKPELIVRDSCSPPHHLAQPP